MKILNKIKRQILKKDSFNLLKIINRYKLNLLIEDKDGILFDIHGYDNLFHLISHRSYLDGSISELLNAIGKQKNYEVGIDVGANFGLSSIIMSRYCNNVIAFEPEPSNLKRLKKILNINNVSNVEVVDKAVADSEGEMSLYVAEASSHHSLGQAHISHSKDKKIPIEVVALDSFCEANGINEIGCLKVDVEGFEEEVFKGASDLLRDKKIKNIVFEISLGVLNRLNRDPYKVLEILEKYNYKIVDSSGLEIKMSSKLESFDGQDLLATPL